MLIKRNSSLSFIIAIFTWLFLSTAFSPNIQAVEPISDQQKLDSVRDLISESYYQALPDEVLQKDSIEKIIENLDRHSDYMTNESYQSFLNSISQQVSGIGVQVEKTDEGLSVVTVFTDGGAELVGIKPGDIIVEADGVALDDLALEVAITKVTGKIGTEVDLKFYRPSDDDYYDVTVVRQLVKVPLIDYKKLGGNVGYIRLISFGDGATDEIKEAIEKINTVDRYIFDVRNNGGGYFNIAQEVLGFFPVVENAILLNEQNEKNIIFPVIKQQVKFEKPVVVLINQYSASASEIVAAAVADYDAAELYGQTSFGKGTMQTMFAVNPELGNQSDVIKLTTGEFFSPLGNKINKVGVTPDVVTESGFELVKAHQDALAEIFSDYQNLGVVANVNPEEMIIRFLDGSLLDELEIEVIELGSEEVPLATKRISESEFEITFSSVLEEESEYVMLLHSNLDDRGAGYLASLAVSEGVEVPVLSIGSQQAPEFTDVIENKTIGYDEILELTNAGVILGYKDDSFRPNEKINRMHVATLLKRELGLEVPSNLAEVLAVYDDVDVDHPLASEIAAVTASGIFKGYDAKFLPNDKISRSEMATVIVRAYELVGNDDVQISLQDIDKISLNEHRQNVLILAQNEVVRGRPDGKGSYYYDGPSSLTRAEFAIMLVNVRNK